MPNADTFANSTGPGGETVRYGDYIKVGLGDTSDADYDVSNGDVVTVDSNRDAKLAYDGETIVGYVYEVTNDLVTIKTNGAGVASAAESVAVGSEVGVGDGAGVTLEAGSFESAGSGWLVLDYVQDHPLSDVDETHWVEVLKL